jgi:hypothetical protein
MALNDAMWLHGIAPKLAIILIRNRWKIMTFPEPQRTYSTVASYYTVTTALIIQLHEYSLEKLCDESYSEKWPRALWRWLVLYTYTHRTYMMWTTSLLWKMCRLSIFPNWRASIHTTVEREKREDVYSTYSTYKSAVRASPLSWCRRWNVWRNVLVTWQLDDERRESHSREQGRQICFETEVLYTSKTPKRDERDEREGPTHIYNTHTDEAFHV